MYASVRAGVYHTHIYKLAQFDSKVGEGFGEMLNQIRVLSIEDLSEKSFLSQSSLLKVEVFIYTLLKENGVSVPSDKSEIRNFLSSKSEFFSPSSFAPQQQQQQQQQRHHSSGHSKNTGRNAFSNNKTPTTNATHNAEDDSKHLSLSVDATNQIRHLLDVLFYFERYIRVYTYAYAYTRTRTRTHTNVHMYPGIVATNHLFDATRSAPTRVHHCTHAYAYTCLSVHTRTHMFIQMFTNTYAHAYDQQVLFEANRAAAISDHVQ